MTDRRCVAMDISALGCTRRCRREQDARACPNKVESVDLICTSSVSVDRAPTNMVFTTALRAARGTRHIAARSSYSATQNVDDRYQLIGFTAGNAGYARRDFASLASQSNRST